MKTHSLALPLNEISESEARTIEGGNPAYTWSALFVAYVVIYIVTNPQAHIAAFTDGYKEGYEALKTSQQ